jgi:hypothetical protein
VHDHKERKKRRNKKVVPSWKKVVPSYKPPDASSNVPHDSRAYDPNSFFSRMDIGQLYFQARGGEGAGRGAPPTQRS